MSKLKAFNFQKWIDEHRHLLKPPVGNQQIWVDADLMVPVVGGPNTRPDSHGDPVEEFFYQLEGNMVLKLYDGKEFYDVPIREGEIFLLPQHVRHSPQLPEEGSIGLVVEPKRQTGELDAVEWYCFECGSLVYRAELQMESIVKDLLPVYQKFYASEEDRTCQKCQTVHPGKEPPEGWVTL
jgi:3-hydroxyanthranilate 3,4-dioxygenase